MISKHSKGTMWTSLASLMLLLSLFFSTGLTMVHAQESEADLNEPEAVTLLITALKVVPDAKDGIENVEALPEDSIFEWDDEEIFNDLTNLIKGKIIVTYSDESVDEVEVDVEVVETEEMDDTETITATDAELYHPSAGDIGLVVEVGVIPEPINGIVNFEELPEGTLFAWESTDVFQTAMAATFEKVIVTYPDGSTEAITVPLSIIEEVTPEDDSDLYQPQVAELISTEIGVVPSAREAIINLDELPEGTTFRWQDDAIFDEAKTELNENLIAEYPDGSEDMVPVLVTVLDEEESDADLYAPHATELMTTEVGIVPEAIDGIKNFEEMPTGTLYAWENESVFNQVAEATHGYVIVTYPDDSRDVVAVTVRVVEDLTPEPEAELYNPIAATLLTTDLGLIPPARDGIENLDELPQSAVFSWDNETVFQTVAATAQATVVVTYADGSIDRVPVPVTVKEASQQVNANVTIRFVDLNGNQLMPARIMARPIGTTYQINRITIEGYVLDSVIGEEKGIVSSNDRENIITYVYRKVPDVVKESSDPEQQLPATGESSNWFITGLAVVLILAGGGILYTRYRNKN